MFRLEGRWRSWSIRNRLATCLSPLWNACGVASQSSKIDYRSLRNGRATETPSSLRMKGRPTELGWFPW